MSKGKPIPQKPADAPQKGEVYRHYKHGDKYRVTGLALNSADDTWMVLYEPMYENAATEFFTRPLTEWNEVVEWEVKKVERFVKI
jgi:hypothetical protein